MESVVDPAWAQSALAALPYPLCVADARLRVRYVNPAGVQLFGNGELALTGRPLAELIDYPADLLALGEPLPCGQHALGVNTALGTQMMQVSFSAFADGRESWVMAALRGIGDQRLQALTRHLLVQQEDERRQLARVLHDDVGQSLTAAMITLQSAQMGVLALNESLYSEVLGALGNCLNDVREMSVGLRPWQLDDLGLEQALDWYLQQQMLKQGHACQFSCHLDERLPAEVETSCFRILQDIVRHLPDLSEWGDVQVQLQQLAGQVQITVRIADVAKAQAQLQNSGWLAGAVERAAMVGGELACQQRGSVISINVSLPMDLHVTGVHS